MTEVAPGRGEIGWVEFHGRAGHEQSGRRPALVLTDQEWNFKRGLAMVCPITSRVAGHLSEAPLTNERVRGVAQVDQTTAIDWRSRHWRSLGIVDIDAWQDAVRKLITIVDPDGQAVE
jgi:mRNA interferase MazF